MTQSLPLLIATDQNLLFAAATTVRAAQLSLSDGFALEVFAYVEGVADQDLARFSSYCEDYLGLTPRLITDRSWSPEDLALMNDLAQAIPKLPRALWARLFLPSLVTGDRALFIDVDVAVVKDLSPLWLMPLNGHTVGAVRDPARGTGTQLAAKHPEVQRYFNAGVMAIDVGRWKQDQVASRCTEWMLTKGRKSHFPDQDALNVVLTDVQGMPLWEELEPIWNAITLEYNPGWVVDGFAPVSPDEVRLRHFAGPFKPWNSQRLPMQEVFDEHLAAVPFEVPLHLRTRSRPSLVRRWARQLRRTLRRG